MNPYQWRPMKAADLPQVMDIAAQVHVGYYEAPEVFAERLSLFPQGCRIAWLRDLSGAAVVLGYAFMHPTRRGHPPALNQLLHVIDEQADCLHLHDVALLPQARGSGLGLALIQEIYHLGRATALPCATLVAVHESGGYWHNAGFEDDLEVPPQGLDALAGYGDGARYMSKLIR
ncbi:GNAT family N-acetyltransferase [Herbaspirillum sp. AP02]|uniref:GNAT family N-acetyltransferase n=1 Tax=unclassified Herbaspirillum TaxID=2624150 RepID=UPI0015D98687|nr:MULTISPECIES: GNAT family N-acetyltransferase [unclassified Herbaspirillum]MBG7618483.1 GNAT family N-acetyltransferase [Herbaspirillum sp. AP02]NZD68643.1 GNAT family N-acetyltransferase [Herbaspirillum sp. AP21]